jgi:hypothetical protein
VKLLVIARPFVFHGGVERATVGLIAPSSTTDTMSIC